MGGAASSAAGGGPPWRQAPCGVLGRGGGDGAPLRRGVLLPRLVVARAGPPRACDDVPPESKVGRRGHGAGGVPRDAGQPRPLDQARGREGRRRLSHLADAGGAAGRVRQVDGLVGAARQDAVAVGLRQGGAGRGRRPRPRLGRLGQHLGGRAVDAPSGAALRLQQPAQLPGARARSPRRLRGLAKHVHPLQRADLGLGAAAEDRAPPLGRRGALHAGLVLQHPRPRRPHLVRYRRPRCAALGPPLLLRLGLQRARDKVDGGCAL
mmetsp:Transcript_12959/g.37421  ORF Transcript_12959/g.37421 Transcript_12959/m.37421 type:complete len:265 (+) Transcript_12959:3-797(+)